MKNKEIEKIVSKFVGNMWLFPKGYSDKYVINESLAFKTYFNENRDYFNLYFDIDGYTINMNYVNSRFFVEHPLEVVVSENKLIELLTQVYTYLSSNRDSIKEKHIQKIQDIKKEISDKKEELRKLKEVL